MKITKIEQERPDIYKITYTPNPIQKFFGMKPYFTLVKDTGSRYHYGDGGVYTNTDGEKLGNYNKTGEAIDNFKRRWD